MRPGVHVGDTAAAYGNEAQVGEAVREFGEKVYVTTKYFNPGAQHGRADATAAFGASLDRLGLDHIDLYLIHWPVRAGEGFVESWRALIFSCLTGQLSSGWRQAGKRGGIWSVPCDSELGPFDLSRATLVAGQSLYSGRIIRDRGGNWVMLAFRNEDSRGHFVGEITDPIPIGWTADYSGLSLLQ